MKGVGPLPPHAAVGIDVVDLRSPRWLAGLPRQRTLARVLAPRELEAVRADPDPAARFREHWAAKEAAYKAVTLVRGAPPVFAHAAFVVDLAGGSVTYGELDLDLVLDRIRSRLVAVARVRGGSFSEPVVWGAGSLSALHRGRGGLEVHELTARMMRPTEAEAVHSLPSALVRLAARKESADFLGVDEGRLAVVCPPGPAGRRPPYLVLDDRTVTDAGLSISHDGGWLAWAVAGRRRAARDVSAAGAGS